MPRTKMPKYFTHFQKNPNPWKMQSLRTGQRKSTLVCAYIQVIYSRLISQTKLTNFCSLQTLFKKAYSYKLHRLEAFSDPMRSATKALSYNRI